MALVCRATPQGPQDFVNPAHDELCLIRTSLGGLANFFAGNALLESSAAEVARLVAGNIQRAPPAFARARGSANHRLHTDPRYSDELRDECTAEMEMEMVMVCSWKGPAIPTQATSRRNWRVQLRGDRKGGKADRFIISVKLECLITALS
jgi:hypothetical protein